MIPRISGKLLRKSFPTNRLHLLVKISKRIGVLGRIRNNLTVDAANKVYQSLVLPVMDYCDVAWSSIGKIERDKLDGAQRRVARIIFKAT